MAPVKKLYRSNDSVFAGVCAGFAEYLDIDAVIVRILAVLLGVVSGFFPMLVLYVLTAVILPRRPVVDPSTIPCAAYVPTRQEPGCQEQGPWAQQPQQPGPTPSASSDPVFQPTERIPYAEQWQAVPQPDASPDSDSALSASAKTGVVIGLLLLFVGIAGFIGTIVADIVWWQLWPAFFLLAGLMLMLVPSAHMPFLDRFSLGISVIAMGVVALALSVGVLAWSSVSMAFANLWPVLIIASGLIVIGSALRNGVFGLVAAACVVGCCVAALTVYAVPGYLDSVVMDMPFIDPRIFDINPWI